jgi:serine/threonine protein kinase
VAKVVVKTGRHTGEEFTLKGERFVLGRRSACEIPIADSKASREHAVILLKDSDFFLRDLSRNGTLLNGRPASKEEAGSLMKFGDRIKIGDTEMELVDEKSEPANIDIPGYKIMERIGVGGMGTVYKAQQLSMDRIVALKILNERYSANSEFVDRFIREARAAGKLNHPNVIHVHDISRANGRHYFSMEFIDGPSVKETLKIEKKLDVNRALDITLQAAKALEFAHENKIVHRDVKPDNIMLTKEGIVKIADLGIAKTFEEGAQSAKEARRVMGTPHYMAPEQALGKAIDHRVDIYSLGATFYHMVTGTTPFAGSTAHEILKAHIQQSLPPIQESNSKVPDPVCFIIERMMAKLPEKRYADMSKLISDIERVQRGVVAGIDRIEAGESTILRAVGGGEKSEDKDKDKKKKKKDEKEKDEERDPDEAETGEQKKIPAPVLAAALIVVFILVVGAIVMFADKNKTPGPGTTPGTGTNNNAPSDPAVNKSHAEAKRLLEAAIAAQKANDPSEYTRNLEEIRNKYPASPSADEAAKRLDEFNSASKAADRKRAEDLLATAKAFEAENPTKLDDAIKKFTAAADASKNYKDLEDSAKAGLAALQQKLDAENARAVDGAYHAAVDAAAAARLKSDYDAGRTALQGFIDKFANAAQKADAQSALEKLNAEAAAKYKEVEKAVATLDIPGALAEWNRYTSSVKDATSAPDVEKAKESLSDRADQLATDELTKASDKAKKYDYLEAQNVLRALKKQVGGIQKWDDLIKGRDDAFRRQKDLHDKFLAAANEKLKAGPLNAPFLVMPKMENIKWKVSRVSGETVNLDAIGAAGTGMTKRLSDLAPKDQYEMYLLFLPKPMTADENKTFGAFCAERGLSAEAQAHELKAGGGQ